MYQVIARKYRPQTFDEVVGQAHAKQTLRNAIDQNRIAHGYIFSGPRGTGKTTMARILAMALNCEGGPSSSPDPQSPVCREIAGGNALDVIEIDAASNRRIDDVRDIRETVRFRPARDPYKVFIIDEAHQITADAFNALLKTLEEPPEWTVFIFCTTEPQAVPATILSRCQHLAFQAIDLQDNLNHLRKICQAEQVEADDDSLLAIAMAGDGSIRDALSTLDQAIAACGKQLEVNAVRDLLGAIPGAVTDRILGAIRDGDPATVLAVADDLFREGRPPLHFCGELIRQVRNLMVMKVDGADSTLAVAGDREREAAREWIEVFSNEDLMRYVQILLKLYEDLHGAMQQRFRLEMGLLKLVYAGRLRSIEELLAGNQPSAPPVPPPSKAKAPPVSDLRTTRVLDSKRRTAEATAPHLRVPSENGSAASGVGSPTRRATASTRVEPDLKAKVLKLAREGDAALYKAIQAGTVARDGDAYVVRVSDDAHAYVQGQLKVVKALIFGAVGSDSEVRLADPAGQPTRLTKPVAVDPRTADSAKTAHERAVADPALRAFRAGLEGNIVRVTDLRGNH